MTAQSTRTERSITGIALAYSLALMVVIAAHPLRMHVYQIVSDLSQLIAPLFAAVAGFLYAARGTHRSRGSRAGWVLISIGCLLWGLGQAVFAYYELILGVDNPFPGLSDIGYLAAYPFLVCGIIMLSTGLAPSGRVRRFLDSAIAAASFGICSWHFLIYTLWNQSASGQLKDILTVAYPLCDVAALFAAAVLVLNGGLVAGSSRVSAMLIAGGVAMVAFTDSLWSYYTLINVYHTGMWIDPGWCYGFMLIGFGALVPYWRPAPETRRRLEEDVPTPSLGSIVGLVAPYAAATAAFVVVMIHDFMDDHRISLSTMAWGMTLLSLVAVRQVFTLLDNQRLARHLRTFNERLEHRVAVRTRELTALQNLTKAVNTALSLERVLAAAESATRDALEADAVLIWLLDPPSTDRKPPSLALHRHVGLDSLPTVLDMAIDQPMRDQVEMFPVIVDADAGVGEKLIGICLRAPIRWQNQPRGMIGVIRWSTGVGLADSELMESIGIEVGTAIENARLYDAAVAAADRDPVTGLYNHRAMHQRLRVEFQRAVALDKPLSVVMMDLNDFKLFNDTYGHPVGDDVLKQVAGALSASSRPGDLLGRYGGDEFIAVLPDTDLDSAVSVARGVQDRMASIGFKRPADERTVPVTLSFGVAAYPQNGTTRHELLTLADANLYEAKRSAGGIKIENGNRRALRALCRDTSFEVLDAMVTAVDNKDRYTGRHSEDVTEYALWIAEALGLSEETMRVIRIGGLLHDVGKIGVPDEILRKPGRLTVEEYEVMKRHARIGALMISAVPGMEEILGAVASHHERWDGQGYPDALMGENIPLLGRIMAVGDAFSAMTTDRPYRKGLDWQVALDELRANSGSQFDPVMVQAFLVASAKYLPLRLSPAPVDEAVVVVA